MKSKSPIKKIHEGKWVALSTDMKKVVAFSDSLATLRKETGDSDVIFTKTLKSDTVYAF